MSTRAIGIAAVVAAVLLTLGRSAAADLPKCDEEATARPEGWQEVLAPGRDITFALPPGFALSEKQPEFVHLGGLWSGPGIEVKVTYGLWGETSFNLVGVDHVCEGHVEDIPVVLMTSGNNLTAWMQTGEEPFEPVLSVSFRDPDDITLARRIIGSARRTDGRGTGTHDEP